MSYRLRIFGTLLRCDYALRLEPSFRKLKIMRNRLFKTLSTLLLLLTACTCALSAQEYGIYGSGARSRMNDRMGQVRTTANPFQSSVANTQYTTRGTSDVYAIHREINYRAYQREDFMGGLVRENELNPNYTGPARSVGRGDVDDAPPGVLTPIGDMLLPLLLCAMAYVAFVYYRKRKEIAL